MSKPPKNPDPGPWRVGSYYKNTIEIYVSEVWGASCSRVKVPPGSVWLCHKTGCKYVEGETRRKSRWLAYVRLLTYDPRFDGETRRYIHFDIPLDGWIREVRGFEEITSALITLALAGEGVAPIVGEE